ncbi:unnamed protein product, partial [Amoebophrya sp. A120]|eukprot:GSA120T00025971001.1
MSQRITAGNRLLSLPAQHTEVPLDKLNEVREVLSKDCGAECVKYWDSVMSTAQKDGKTVLSALQEQTADTFNKMKEFQAAVEHEDPTTALAEFQATHSAFLKERSTLSSAVPMMDAPCFDAKSCKLVEALGNRCNFGRVATLAIYQAINLPIHVLGVATKILCACIDVYTASTCLLRFAPFCGPVHSLMGKVWGINNSVW